MTRPPLAPRPPYPAPFRWRHRSPPRPAHAPAAAAQHALAAPLLPPAAPVLRLAAPRPPLAAPLLPLAAPAAAPPPAVSVRSGAPAGRAASGAAMPPRQRPAGTAPAARPGVPPAHPAQHRESHAMPRVVGRRFAPRCYHAPPHGLKPLSTTSSCCSTPRSTQERRDTILANVETRSIARRRARRPPRLGRPRHGLRGAQEGRGRLPPDPVPRDERRCSEPLDHNLKITDGVLRFRMIKLRPGTPAPPDLRPRPWPPPRQRPRRVRRRTGLARRPRCRSARRSSRLRDAVQKDCEQIVAICGSAAVTAGPRPRLGHPSILRKTLSSRKEPISGRHQHQPGRPYRQPHA